VAVWWRASGIGREWRTWQRCAARTFLLPIAIPEGAQVAMELGSVTLDPSYGSTTVDISQARIDSPMLDAALAFAASTFSSIRGAVSPRPTR